MAMYTPFVPDLEPKIAVFIDYDNIAIGLREAGADNFEVGRVLERLLEKGRIIYKRAYADWSMFRDATQGLHEAAVELVDIPMRRSIGKNSADIRMVVDALDLCYTKEHIDTFVIGSGDSDFSPLVSKLKENDKRVIGFGLRASTSNLLANNCDEFLFYEDLVSLPGAKPLMPTGLTKRQHDAFGLLLDAVAGLLRENKDVLWGSLIKDTIRRKRPSFNESQYGYNSFSQLLEDAAAHGLIGLFKDPKSGGTPVVTGFGAGFEPKPAPAPVKSSVARSSSLLVKRDGGPKAGAGTAQKEKSAPQLVAKKRAVPPARTKETAAKRTAARRPAKSSAKDAEAAEAPAADVESVKEKPKAVARRTPATRRKTVKKSAPEAQAPKPKEEDVPAAGPVAGEPEGPAKGEEQLRLEEPAADRSAAADKGVVEKAEEPGAAPGTEPEKPSQEVKKPIVPRSRGRVRKR